MKKLNKKDEQRAASTENILACALDLFVKNGYRGTTIDQIAAKAELTKGAIYFYFKTKDAIMLRLLDQAEENVVDPIAEHLAGAGPGADAKLVRFIHSQSKLGVTSPQQVLLLILVSIEFCGTASEIELRVKAIYERMYRHIEAIIEQGQREGTFRSDISCSDMTSIVMAAHDGLLVEWYRHQREAGGKSLANGLRATLLNGLMKQA